MKWDKQAIYGADARKYLIGWAGILLLLPQLAWGNELEIIQLKHRSAEDVLPVVRPLLDAGDVANGMNYQLILRTSPRNLEQIRKLLESIDVAPRRLKITVLQNADRETAARLTGVSGNANVGGGVRVIVPDSGDSSGLNVELGQGQNRLKAKVISTRALEDERNTQQLQVLEGNRALVRSGQSVPVPQRQVIQDQWGARVIDSMQYQEAGSGFYVLPRVSGDRVTLEISTQNDTFVPDGGDYPTTRIQQTSSTLSGRLGEWLEMSGLGQQKDSDDSTLSTRGTSRTSEQHHVLIKVEEIK
ncbi:MAG TPA: secretin N-terminal domain-containing protein [Gallionella sp.]|jgi:type II secretory pathway component GspD/PulD (secretin)|nr:secretin N-terminal domain-containing protein [Gallionella sp.]